jgi:hypothetical protein
MGNEAMPFAGSTFDEAQVVSDLALGPMSSVELQWIFKTHKKVIMNSASRKRVLVTRE